jgi:hypothetical protein
MIGGVMPLFDYHGSWCLWPKDEPKGYPGEITIEISPGNNSHIASDIEAKSE